MLNVKKHEFSFFSKPKNQKEPINRKQTELELRGTFVYRCASAHLAWAGYPAQRGGQPSSASQQLRSVCEFTSLQCTRACRKVKTSVVVLSPYKNQTSTTQAVNLQPKNKNP